MRRSVLFGITILAALAATALGFWQLRRHGERKAINSVARAGLELPPLDLSGGSAPEPWRRASARGFYDEAEEFLLRGRSVQGVPAVQVVTPLRLEGRDTAILVNRGYVPAPDAANPGEATWSEPGPVAVRGVLLPVPDQGGGQPIRQAERESWKSLDLTAMRSRLPYPVAPVYLMVEADSGSEHTVRGRSYPIRAALPALDGGPHLSYAIQWFGIALAALAFGFFFVLRRTSTTRVE